MIMAQSERAHAMPETLSPTGAPLPTHSGRRLSVASIDGSPAMAGRREVEAAAPKVEATTAPSARHYGWQTRALSLTALVATVAATGYLARGGYYAAVDSWVVPSTLTPESDAAIQMNLQLNDQLVERTRLHAESERNDADIISVSAAIRRLEMLRDDSDGALVWSAREAADRATSMTLSISSLREQRALLHSMLLRGKTQASKTEKNVKDGLASDEERERDQQALAQTQLAMVEVDRQVQASRNERDELMRMSTALKTHSTSADGRAPEVVDREERDVRLVLEIEKLEAEKRSLAAAKLANDEALAKRDESIADLRSRPLFRALQERLDLAFVPYAQLKNVAVGSELVSCSGVVFGCRVVGRVAEILPGEVATSDPWADMARGQYVVLDLSDRDAAHEKTLRVRNHAAVQPNESASTVASR
jgi:hypothetical protein